jgi:maltooligosyltrehalose trehalohydrolase
VVRYFVENSLQWLDEFHFDALRLDAIHSIFDQNAQPFLACLSEAIDNLARDSGRRIHLIAESDLNEPRVVMPREVSGLGLDAQWSDDFHHALHSLQTTERNGYYADFGRVSDLARAFRRGFVYEGQYSQHRKRRHGASAAQIEGRRMVVCSQNHDQVGNRMLGDRSSQLLTFEAQKLSAAVVLWSPFLPLLFMGEEVGELAPFQYFTSHGDPSLVEAVRAGRQREFESFAWQQEVPDPQSEQTFAASKVRAIDQPNDQQRALLDFYRELIRLRKSLPSLRHLNKDNVKTEAFEDPAFLQVLRWCDHGEVALLLNFSDQTVSVPTSLPGGNWIRVLDSADHAWRGPGASVPHSIDGEHFGKLSTAPRSAALLARE